MSARILLVFLSVVFISACGNDQASTTDSAANQLKKKNPIPPETTSTKKEGYKFRDGLYIERPSAQALQTDFPYNLDNKVFQTGRIFVYDYVMTRKSGQVVICKIVEQKGIPMRKAWTFLPIDQKGEDCILEHQIRVFNEENRMLKFLSKKDLTFVQYRSETDKGPIKGISLLGMVENAENIFLPNPVGRIFNVLQSAPPLYVKSPRTVGNEYDYTIEVPSKYSDPRWGDWQENEVMNFKYKITDETTIDTPFGNLPCIEIQASGGGLIGQSALTTYFNEEYGFVQMTYKNIDGSTMVMKLTEIRQEDPKQ